MCMQFDSTQLAINVDVATDASSQRSLSVDYNLLLVVNAPGGVNDNNDGLCDCIKSLNAFV